MLITSLLSSGNYQAAVTAAWYKFKHTVGTLFICKTPRVFYKMDLIFPFFEKSCKMKNKDAILDSHLSVSILIAS